MVVLAGGAVFHKRGFPVRCLLDEHLTNLVRERLAAHLHSRCESLLSHHSRGICQCKKEDATDVDPPASQASSFRFGTVPDLGPCSSICLGPYDGLRGGGAISYKQGTPVRLQLDEHLANLVRERLAAHLHSRFESFF